MRVIALISRRPVSGQSRGKRRYQASLASEAKRRVGDQVVRGGRLYTRIIWFHAASFGGQDIDNIIKPIHDALVGIVYEDDVLISQCTAARIDLTARYELPDEGLPSKVYDELVDRLARAARATEERQRHVLYVEVGDLAGQRVAFGPGEGAGP